MEAASGAVLAALASRSAGAATPAATPREVARDGRRPGGTRSYCFFSKHLPDLDWTDLAAATIDMGFDGIDLTVRPKGHVAPERVTEDLPRALDAIRAKGTTVAMITTELTSASHPTANADLRGAGKAGIKLAKVGYWKYALEGRARGSGRDGTRSRRARAAREAAWRHHRHPQPSGQHRRGAVGYRAAHRQARSRRRSATTSIRATRSWKAAAWSGRRRRCWRCRA